MKDNFAAMEIKICPICGVEHSNNSGVLISKNLKPIKKENTITGYELCEEHKKLFTSGYLCLIGVDNNNSVDTRLKFENANRTGEIIHIKKSVAKSIFNIEINSKVPFVFVQQEVIEMLKNEMKELKNSTLH
jgi:hypothetical protein